jgi:PAS domain S-box-containing protein
VFRVLYLCVAEQHDIRLVALAGFVCVIACFTAINLLVRGREAGGKRQLALVSAAAAVFGAGVWTTHFVAELAFTPGLPIVYNTDLTALSLVFAISVAWIGMIIAVRFRAALIGGSVIGAAVGAMHYVGMAAMRVPADTSWNIAYVAVSLTFGIALAVAAAWVAWRGPAWRFRLAATVLLVAGICALHFIGMVAIELTANPLIAIPDNVVAPELLAVLVAAAAIGIVMLGMSASIVEERLGQHAKHEAEELRRNQAHLARVLRISGIGSVERDLKTGHVEWSAEACRIFGVDHDDVENTREYFYSLVHPDDRVIVRTATDQSDQGLASAPLEYRIVRPDGEVRVVYRENDLLLDETGQSLHRVSVFKDVTEAHAAQARERQLERELMHSQKLEALGTLAGGVAHDLNNTLVPIVALSKLALEELPEGCPARGDIETIIRASERARDLVKQILAFSRKQDFAKEAVDFARVTRDALQMLRASVPATIQIVDQILEVPPVFGDAGELHQVIVNLVTNAAQAIGGGVGRITLRLWGTTQQSSPHREAGPVVCVSIADTGCGMEDAMLDRIFEPFFTTKGVGEGTGLGLSVVHGIVTRHGGTITVRSKPGEGSEFTLLLPASAQAGMAVHVEPAVAA